jgi:hypothetical protein
LSVSLHLYPKSEPNRGKPIQKQLRLGKNLKNCETNTTVKERPGYSDFYNLMGFTSKKMPNNSLENVCLKSFPVG